MCKVDEKSCDIFVKKYTLYHHMVPDSSSKGTALSLYKMHFPTELALFQKDVSLGQAVPKPTNLDMSG